MDKLVRSIKFPFVFDKEQLKIETNKLLKNKWIDHYNTNDYSGKWTSIALMSNGGSSTNINAFSCIKEDFIASDVLDYCNYIKEIIDSFLFQKTAVRLLNLGAGAEIKPHTDHCLGYEDGAFRLHIPIITNSDVIFILDNKRLIMNEGECWYLNANFLHSVKNGGQTDRIHLVIDGIRNDWTDNIFLKEAKINQFTKPIPIITENQKKLIISELERMILPIAKELINNLKK
ncbi:MULTISPECIES: aspartyl/asparaginyl beta-hydroxylase domain-containing protein [unclassified Flavobacterium]|uniref:aspartyl/asparaginyl beta-hydroxylase domain-containing protein n=1 Tax=unclassified Flavobacterium TaxID=196869 RepID=UPI001291ECC0|nr:MULTISPECIES: aspartyl/asparaginyl beta-hydroxylase domain-containing protein [unclassified Flavobacterium]MQP52198.1 aspartyl/asparaginyl beta-hydroxylase domain-containing protein [Flavobacterium sp. LMO9]MQP62068.1 aspartyl/asparaginyl beta-hydroxylase domain-containing protein [Flavobacterium sp. LMO6]